MEVNLACGSATKSIIFNLLHWTHTILLNYGQLKPYFR